MRKIILSIIISIVITLLIHIYVYNEMIFTPFKKYENVEKELKTGDIIVFRYNLVDCGFRMFSKFSHVSMVIRKGNDLFSFEIHPEEFEYNSTKVLRKEGVELYPLLKRLKEYNGEVYLLKLKNEHYNEEISKKIIQKIDEYKKIQFDNNFKNYFVLNMLLYNLNLPVIKKDTMFCSEFIGHILNDINLYKIKQDKLCILSPCSFVSLPIYNKKITKLIVDDSTFLF